MPKHQKSKNINLCVDLTNCMLNVRQYHDFLDFGIFVLNSSSVISRKISRSLRFFCIGAYLRSRRAPCDFAKTPKVKNIDLCVEIDQICAESEIMSQFYVFWYFCSQFFICDLQKNFQRVSDFFAPELI